MKFNVMAVLPLAMATIHVSESIADTFDRVAQHNSGSTQNAADNFNSAYLFGAGDSFGAGDRPEGFISFPTNEANFDLPSGTSSFIHYGVLYIEIKRDVYSEYEPYFATCVRTANRQIIGSASTSDIFLLDKQYMLSGRYKRHIPKTDTYDQLKLTLQGALSKKKERIVLNKHEYGQYEFYGYSKIGKDYLGTVRAYYKGREAYDVECSNSFGYAPD